MDRQLMLLVHVALSQETIADLETGLGRHAIPTRTGVPGKSCTCGLAFRKRSLWLTELRGQKRCDHAVLQAESSA